MGFCRTSQVQQFVARRAIIILNYSLACGFCPHKNLPHFKPIIKGKNNVFWYCSALLNTRVPPFQIYQQLPWFHRTNMLRDDIHVSKDLQDLSCFWDEQRILTALVLWHGSPPTEVLTEAKLKGDHTENSPHSGVGSFQFQGFGQACLFSLSCKHAPTRYFGKQ